eukprot:4775331-Prymnesium_polylepis.1
MSQCVSHTETLLRALYGGSSRWGRGDVTPSPDTVCKPVTLTPSALLAWAAAARLLSPLFALDGS